MELRSGDTLEVSSIVGDVSGYSLVRCFAAPEGDAIMEETLILRSAGDSYRLMLAIDQECTGLLELARDRWLAIGSFGDLHFIEDQNRRFVAAGLTDERFLTSFRKFQGPEIVATGLGGALLRLLDERWEGIAPGIESDLYDTERTPDGALWFAGSGGCLGSVRGGAAAFQDVPTNADLHSLAHLADGELLVGGARGTVLIGDGQRWRDIGLRRDEDVTAVRKWRDEVFLSAGDAVLRLDGGALVEDGRFRSSDLQVAMGRLWSLDVEGVRVREGDVWREVAVVVDLPERGPTVPRPR